MGCLGNNKTEDQRNEEKEQRENNKKINKQLQKDKQIYRATHRLLLLGGFCVIYGFIVCVLSETTCLSTLKKKVYSIWNSGRVKCDAGDRSVSDAVERPCLTQTCLLHRCMIVEQDEPVRRLTDGCNSVKAAHGGSETSGSAFCLLVPFFSQRKQIQCSALVLVPLAWMYSISDNFRWCDLRLSDLFIYYDKCMEGLWRDMAPIFTISTCTSWCDPSNQNSHSANPIGAQRVRIKLG